MPTPPPAATPYTNSYTKSSTTPTTTTTATPVAAAVAAAGPAAAAGPVTPLLEAARHQKFPRRTFRRAISQTSGPLSGASRRRAECAGNPRIFRQSVRLDPLKSTRLGELIQPWQKADFAALDEGWKAIAGIVPSDSTTLRRAWVERPRGHSKTSDMAVQIAWALAFAKRPLRGIAAAADREQAGLIADAVRNIALANPGLCGDLHFRQNVIENPKNDARLDLISSDVASSYGLTPDFVICDELCHWPDEELWHSLASAAVKKPHCLLTVLTNAGAGRGWQWQLRETARTQPDWHFSSLDGSQAPWIRSEDLAAQQAILPPGVFDRLWNNRWQDAAGDFLTSDEVSACRDDELRVQDRGRHNVQYIAAIDYAEKQDLTAAVILHREAERLVIDRLDVAVPTATAPVLVDWVEQWVGRAAAAFPKITFVVDEHQLQGTVQRLSRRHRFVRFPFAAGKGNHSLALTLRRVIVHRQIGWYAGCGARPDDPSDDLERELASLVLKQSPGGRIRFDHPAGSHDDRAFVVASAAWHATTTGTTDPLWQVTLPGEGGLL